MVNGNRTVSGTATQAATTAVRLNDATLSRRQVMVKKVFVKKGLRLVEFYA